MGGARASPNPEAPYARTETRIGGAKARGDASGSLLILHGSDSVQTTRIPVRAQ